MHAALKSLVQLCNLMPVPIKIIMSSYKGLDKCNSDRRDVQHSVVESMATVNSQ